MQVRKVEESSIEKERLWYKRAIIYQLHVRSFFDANQDGVGDFAGLTQKLDYLKDLGVTAVWLLPFYPSPLKDDGYDIADYYAINPMYGTLDDFKMFLEAAHARGLRVITELVINHTSDQHAWFQRARRAPAGSVERDYYVWSETPEKYKETRIIFPDFEPSNWTWDPVAKAYYWHRFFFHQPDLNFDNPVVHEEIIRILDFWLGMGVDGMRLDAIPYLYEREGTSCESLPETHAFLRKIRKYVDEKYGDRVFLAEANQWPEQAVHFFGEGQGDECHMAFHFPLMPRLFMSVQMEDRFPIIDILAQTPAIPETSQWAIFLRNHDELTLEMVTDEERDYMYRMYATDPRSRINLGIRRRLAPLMGNDRRKIELLNTLLLSLPGTPVIYYGDEIGMGDNPYLGDRNGVRTPMHWTSDKNAGFSRATPQALFFPVIVEPEYHYESINVETQERNPNSLLWWMKRILSLRKRWGALAEGELEFLHPANRKILAYLRRRGEEVILVVANLSRFAQSVELNLSGFDGYRPIELFGHTSFPRISSGPYPLTLGAYAYYVCLLRRPESGGGRTGGGKPVMRVRDEREVFEAGGRNELQAAIAGFLPTQSWFQGQSRTVTSVGILQVVRLSERFTILRVSVEYNETPGEEYLIPVSLVSGEGGEELLKATPELVIGEVEFDGTGRLLVDATALVEFWEFLRVAIENPGGTGPLKIWRWAEPFASGEVPSEQVRFSDKSNSSAASGFLFIKVIRRIEAGVHPELEIGQHLAGSGFTHAPRLVASGDLIGEGRKTGPVLICTERISNTRTAWEVTLDSIGRYFERILSQGEIAQVSEGEEAMEPLEAAPIYGTYPESARLMAQRLAELHKTLADAVSGEMVPEMFYPFSQRSLYQSMRNQGLRALQQLGTKLGLLSPAGAKLAEDVIRAEGTILKIFKQLYEEPLEALRIRCHGNMHLGQILHTGKDFVFIDFEGEPDRPYGERRIKRSALRDVATLLRSFERASQRALAAELDRGHLTAERKRELQHWSGSWPRVISDLFLQEYRRQLEGSQIIPKEDKAVRALLHSHFLEACFQELTAATEEVKVVSAMEAILNVVRIYNADGEKGT